LSAPLAGRVAVVTGSARGIGRALAIGLAEAGAAVVCAARTLTEGQGSMPGSLSGTVQTIEDLGGAALAVRCDVGDPGDVDRLLEASLARFGRIDVLVNNAMSQVPVPFTEMTLDEWDQGMTANTRGFFLMCRGVVDVMRAGGGGSIVNISSGGATLQRPADVAPVPPGLLAYCVAKAALERLTVGLAEELEPWGIAVNAIQTGRVHTERAESIRPGATDWEGWMRPEQVVPPVVFLAAQRPPGLTGQVTRAPDYGSTWP
jgi:NAD(P)-dependent dehydrogenase (short-subunit alcohol dehydrogenase family)